MLLKAEQKAELMGFRKATVETGGESCFECDRGHGPHESYNWFLRNLHLGRQMFFVFQVLTVENQEI